MIENDNRKGAFPVRHVHHTRDGQIVAGIANEVFCEAVCLGDSISDLDVPTRVDTLAQSLDRVASQGMGSGCWSYGRR